MVAFHPETWFLVLMGVAGSGKSTVAPLVAQILSWGFVEGDDFHPPANIHRMIRGQPLSDEDRIPFFRAVRRHMDSLCSHGCHSVIACSALRAAHRETLATGCGIVRFAMLEAPPNVLRDRLATRGGHHFGPALLDSQLTDLQPPSNVPVFSTGRHPNDIATDIACWIAAETNRLDP